MEKLWKCWKANEKKVFSLFYIYERNLNGNENDLATLKIRKWTKKSKKYLIPRKKLMIDGLFYPKSKKILFLFYIKFSFFFILNFLLESFHSMKAPLQMMSRILNHFLIIKKIHKSFSVLRRKSWKALRKIGENEALNDRPYVYVLVWCI